MTPPTSSATWPRPSPNSIHTSPPRSRAKLARTTKPSPAEEARLLETRDILPGRRLSSWSAPRIARAAQPGQFLHVISPRTPGLLLPALPVAGFDRVAGTIVLLHPDRGGPTEELARVHPGGPATFDGPLGRGFAIDARSRYLLLVADSGGFARVRAAVDEAVAGGRQVTVLLGVRSVAEVYPSSLLPEQVEYVVATQDGSLGHHGSVAELVIEYEAWADQCLAAGSPELVARLVALARGRDARMGVARLGRRRGRRPDAGGAEARRRAWLQIALRHDAGCALGICAGCAIDGTDGTVRVCREGPAFAAAELRMEPAR